MWLVYNLATTAAHKDAYNVACVAAVCAQQHPLAAADKLPVDRDVANPNIRQNPEASIQENAIFYVQLDSCLQSCPSLPLPAAGLQSISNSRISFFRVLQATDIKSLM